MKRFWFLLLLTTQQSAAQVVQRWNHVYDEAGATELVGGVCLFDDTTYRIASSWSAGGIGHMSPGAVSSTGDTLWRKEYVNGSGVFQPGGTHATAQADGRWYWTGGIYPSGGGDPDGALFCFDANGDSLWLKVYAAPGFDGFNAMTLVEGGGACLVGIMDDGQADIYVVRVDDVGDTLWTGRYVGATEENSFSVVETQDGGFAIGAFRWITNNDVATLLLKIDSVGNFQWQRTYGTPYRDNGCSVAELSDGTFVLATGFGVAPVPNTRKQATLIKTDEFGFQQWTSSVNDSDFTYFGAAPLVMANGSYVVSGGRRDGSGDTKGMLMNLDAAGTTIWERNYFTNANADQYIYDLRRTLDGGFIMAGTAFDTVPPLSQDAWLVKTDSFGCLVPGCEIFDGVLEQYTDLLGALTVSPNPTSDLVKVGIELPPGLVTDGRLTLTLIDTQGRRVQEERFMARQPSHALTLSLGTYPSGIYFLHLTNGRRWLSGAKVILE